MTHKEDCSHVGAKSSDVGLILAIYLYDITNHSPGVQLSSKHTHFEWVDPTKAAEFLSMNYQAELIEKLAVLQLPLTHKIP